jgi:hypothetical protein
MTGFDGEGWFAKQIRDRVHKRNLNAIILWTGLPGSGKSYSALRLAELVDDSFHSDRIVFPAVDFLRVINEDLPRGACIVWDDAGLGMPSDEWYTFFNRAVGYVAQSFRYRNLVLSITVPHDTFIDTVRGASPTTTSTVSRRRRRRGRPSSSPTSFRSPPTRGRSTASSRRFARPRES